MNTQTVELTGQLTEEEQLIETRERLNRQTERPAAKPEKSEPENTKPKNRKLNIVTGAFGYTGHYISEMLLANDQWVETITNGKHQVRRNSLNAGAGLNAGMNTGTDAGLGLGPAFSTEYGPESDMEHDVELGAGHGDGHGIQPSTHPGLQSGINNNRTANLQAYPYNFRDPRKLVNALHGCDTLYNTYWARLAQTPQEFTQAVRNSQILIKAAQEAGVRRFIHVSAMNPQGTTEIPYFRSKAMVEQNLRDSGLSYAIIRPGLIFGQDDLFLNNLAWMIRRLPVLAIPGDGEYRIQPIQAHEFAAQVIRAGTQTYELHRSIEDAAGPEAHTFNQIVEILSEHVQKKIRTIHLSHEKALKLNSLTGKLMVDMPLGPEESRTLESDLLLSDHAPTASIKLSEWLASNRFRMGLVQTYQPARNREPKS